MRFSSTTPTTLPPIHLAVEDGEPTTLEAFAADNAECIDPADIMRLASASPGDVVNIDCGGGATAVRVLGVLS